MTPLHVLTRGMGMGMGLVMCSLISSNIWVPWAQAYNLQFLRTVKVINQSINNTVHQ